MREMKTKPELCRQVWIMERSLKKEAFWNKLLNSWGNRPKKRKSSLLIDRCPIWEMCHEY